MPPDAKPPVSRASLFRQRLPFFPLLLCAGGGILLAHLLPWPSAVWAVFATIGLGTFLLPSRLSRPWLSQSAFTLFLICAFATIHLWQSRESAGARFSDWLGDQKIIGTVTGMVNSEPRVFSDKEASFQLWATHLHSAEKDIPLFFPLLINWKGSAPAYGTEVEITGDVQKLAPPRNPGQFNYAAWSASHGVFAMVDVAHENDERILGSGHGNPAMIFALHAKVWMEKTLSLGVNDSVVSNFILAMVLGDTTALPQPIQEEFRGTGTYHLFSVSGLHVGILAVILWQVLKPTQIPRRIAAGLIIPLLFFYALMTGFQAASVRSALMGSIVLLGLMAKRRPLLLNNMFAAGFLILLLDTNQLYDAGFQLSFTVVTAILLCSESLDTFLGKPLLPDPFFPERLLSRTQRFFLHHTKKFVSVTAVSLAAWAGSLFLTINYFHLVSLSTLPANLIAVPLSFGIMAVATLSLLGGLISPWLSGVFNQVSWLLAKMLLAAVHLCASLPGSYFYLSPLEHPKPLLNAVVFDFGSGGACWFETGGKSWLLDCGPMRFHNSVLVPFLRSEGLRSLDGLLLTHGDAGHVGAAVQLLQSCPPRLVIESPYRDRSSARILFDQALAVAAHPKSLCRAGDVIQVSPDAKIEILYPLSAAPTGIADDQAIVARLSVGSTRILFLSDAGLATEEWLLAHARSELACDILVRGAHKSGSRGTLGFLDAARPKVLIATAADFPATERIPEDWAKAVVQRGIQLFRQDECGAVTIKIFPARWEVSSFLGKQSYQHSR